MIQVLIVDDSPLQVELLQHVLSSDPEIKIVATAKDGEDAIAKVKKYNPDVVTMDIHMPKMDGIEATRNIMRTNPVPIVVICGCSSSPEIFDTFEAMEAGAVSVAKKINFTKDDPTSFIENVKLMAGVKVVRRLEHYQKKIENQNEHLTKKSESKIFPVEKIDIIAIGVSTGGPQILKELFSNLSDTFPPIVVVQHISHGFIEGFSEWLSENTKKKVIIADHNQNLKPNTIYFAPDKFQMSVNADSKINLSACGKIDGHCPSATYLFNSIASNYKKNAVGILLTGMGRDGAQGLKQMKEQGAYTIAQDPETSIINGMPGEAVAINAVLEVLTPQEIADFINKLSNEN